MYMLYMYVYIYIYIGIACASRVCLSTAGGHAVGQYSAHRHTLSAEWGEKSV